MILEIIDLGELIINYYRMKKTYYFFYLEMSLRNSSDSNIYAFINVSHIPTIKLIEIFGIDVDKDALLQDGYFLTKTKYKKYKKFINANIGAVNLDFFEYVLFHYVSNKRDEVRKMYKLDLYEDKG